MATNSISRRVQFGRPAGLYWGVGLQPARWNTVEMDAPGQIEFTLSPRAVNSGYRFNTNDPISVCVDNGACPPAGSSHPEISLVSCTDDTVIVEDRYTVRPARFRYQLNVLDSTGNPSPIDPIIEN